MLASSKATANYFWSNLLIRQVWLAHNDMEMEVYRGVAMERDGDRIRGDTIIKKEHVVSLCVAAELYTVFRTSISIVSPRW